MTQPFPDVIRIETSGKCNFRCTHCPIGREGGKRPVLSFDRFIQYFDALPIVPRVLVLYHGGEPLINQQLESMIIYAKLKGVQKTVLNTNASLLSNHRAETLTNAGLDEVRISFDGDSPEENDVIRAGGHFYRSAPIVRQWALSPAHPSIVIYNARHGTSEPAQYLLDYFADCPVTFRGEKIREWARVRNAPTAGNGTRFCSNLFETFTILSDGSVPMCCEDLQLDAPQGKIAKPADVGEIWDRMQAVRDAFAARDYPELCRSCWVTK